MAQFGIGGTMRSCLVFAVLIGCSEYDIKGDVGPVTGATTTSVDTTEVTTSMTDEDCDGIDNNGNGSVDEGFPDFDLDGLADCLDDTCEVSIPGADVVPVLVECEPYDAGLVADPWNISLEWSFTLSGPVFVSPVTGQLTDDNGDGQIDDLDTPDVAFTSSGGNLYIVSGDGTGQICSQAGWQTDGGVIIADVDGDGRNEVAGPLAAGQVRAVDGNCVTKWTSPASFGFLYPVSTAADLDGNGTVEVIADVAVVDGATGATVMSVIPQNTVCWRTPMTGDIDLDGFTEIILGNSVFSSTGARLWDVVRSGTSCFNALANLDADPEAEVLFAYGNQLTAHEHDGTLKWTAGLSVSNPGPPCAGDIDGDGEVEIVVPNGSLLTAFEANGAFKWSAPMSDSSGAAGCVVFDMNGDSIYEVLFADEQALRVYDGTTGTVLWQNLTHDSVTYFETPTVADVDGDGSAEMLVVNSGTTVGLNVYGHNGSGWPESGPTWGLHDFSASNQAADGAIPSNPVPPWLAHNICRGRPYADLPGRPNLAVTFVDACISSCDPAVGIVTIVVQPRNDGGLLAETSSVSLYLVSGATEAWFASLAVPGLVPGERPAALTFEVPVTAWTGEGVLRADDDGSGAGAIDECYEDDNEVRFALAGC